MSESLFDQSVLAPKIRNKAASFSPMSEVKDELDWNGLRGHLTCPWIVLLYRPGKNDLWLSGEKSVTRAIKKEFFFPLHGNVKASEARGVIKRLELGLAIEARVILAK